MYKETKDIYSVLSFLIKQTKKRAKSKNILESKSRILNKTLISTNSMTVRKARNIGSGWKCTSFSKS